MRIHQSYWRTAHTKYTGALFPGQSNSDEGHRQNRTAQHWRCSCTPDAVTSGFGQPAQTCVFVLLLTNDRMWHRSSGGKAVSCARCAPPVRLPLAAHASNSRKCGLLSAERVRFL